MEEIKGLDDYIQKVPEEKLVGWCEGCGHEIYDNDSYYKLNCGKVHKDCLEEFSISYFDAELENG